MNIGKKILDLRLEKGLTRRDLSLLSGVSQQVLYTIENEKHNPNRLTCVKIALGFQIEPDAFITWHESEERRKFPLTLLISQVVSGLSSKEISHITGISELMISFYHRGKIQPDNLATIIKLADALHIDHEVLIGAWRWERLSQDCRKTEDGKLYCCSCNIPKLPDEFHNLTASKSGKVLMCKICREKRRQKRKEKVV